MTVRNVKEYENNSKIIASTLIKEDAKKLKTNSKICFDLSCLKHGVLNEGFI